MDTTALMVQLTPRSTKPGIPETGIQSSVAKNDWESASAEADVEAPISLPLPWRPAPKARPAPVVAENKEAGQAPIDFHVLENDIAAYRRVTEVNPRNDRAWDALGNMYEAAGLHSEAIAAFEQAIALAPRKETYHFHLGIALAYQMRYDKAIQALQKVIALNPNFVLGPLRPRRKLSPGRK